MEIMNFNSYRDLHRYINPNFLEYVGEGSEGFCYRYGDSFVYKEIDYSVCDKDYHIDEIIVADDCPNPSFIFPRMLFTVKNKLAGYICDYVPIDLFNLNVLRNGGISDINFDSLINAFCVFRNDLVELSNNGIKISNLPFNLLFDGEHLFAIDTCHYKRKSVNFLAKNLEELDEAIKVIFRFNVDVDLSSIDDTLDAEDYLVQVKNYLSKKACTKERMPYVETI